MKEKREGKYITFQGENGDRYIAASIGDTIIVSRISGKHFSEAQLQAERAIELHPFQVKPIPFEVKPSKPFEIKVKPRPKD